MVEQVARDCLPARPAEGPVGRIDVLFLHPGFGRLPDRHIFAGEPKLELRHHGRRLESGVGADETFGIGRQTRHQPNCPATMAASISQPSCLLALNLARQSGWSCGLRSMICQAKCAATAASTTK